MPSAEPQSWEVPLDATYVQGLRDEAKHRPLQPADGYRQIIEYRESFQLLRVHPTTSFADGLHPGG